MDKTYSIYQGNEVSQDMFEEFMDLEHYTWPKEDPAYLPEEYVRGLYKDSNEGLFLAFDKNTNHLAGYLNVIFVDEESFNKYYKSHIFTDLKAKPINKQDNLILYIYTANLYPQYRGTSCMKELGHSFALWLDDLVKQGYKIDKVYSEAVSQAGAKIIIKSFKMLPMEDVKDGLGHYYSDDALKQYRLDMKSL